MKRYSIIREKNKREIVLLRGSGCKWRKCRFCDYHLDFSKDEEENFSLNREILQQVTGCFGVLETINSGSFCDLDQKTIREIIKTCKKNRIDQLHIETHWNDRDTLFFVRERFLKAGIHVIVKMGVETFDASYRENVLNKGMGDVSPAEIAQFADEVCLLFGLEGQTAVSMERDVETGLRFFDRVCINLMTENSTPVKPDQKVLELFFRKIYPKYKEEERIDILLENTDFGVGGV